MTTRRKFLAPEGFKLLVESQRLMHGLSLEDLSELTGMSVSFVSRILSGVRGLPCDEDILRLAEALEIEPPERLLIEAGRAPKRTLPLLRATSGLSASELREVVAKAEELIKTRKAQRKSES